MSFLLSVQNVSDSATLYKLCKESDVQQINDMALLFPCPAALSQSFSFLKRTLSKLCSEKVPVEESMAREGTEQEMALQKYTLRGRLLSIYKNWGRYKFFFSLWHSTAPKPIVNFFHNTLSECGFTTSIKDASFFKLLKEIGNFVKKFNALFADNWWWLVNMELSGGYMVGRESNLWLDVEDWLLTEKPHEWEDCDFTHYYTAGVNKVFDVKDVGPQKCDIDAWIHDMSKYARPASSGGVPTKMHFKATVIRDGEIVEKEVKPDKSKWSALLSMTEGEIKNIMTVPRAKYHLTCFPKEEAGKIRSVINGDMNLYLPMLWLVQLTENVLKHNKDAVLFLETEDRIAMVREILSWTSGGGINAPMDQGSFDHAQSMPMILTFIKIWVETLHRYYSNEDILRVGELVTYAVQNSYVSWGGKSAKVINGIPSGWAATALADLVLNQATFNAVITRARELGFSTWFIGKFLGDDSSTYQRGYVECAIVWWLYTAAGFDVNISKFFLSPDHNEFLRMVYTPKGVIGYPARIIANLLWRKPWLDKQPETESAGEQVCVAWLKLLSRGAPIQKVLDHMRNDLMGYFQKDQKAVDDFLNYMTAPTWQGGRFWGADVPGVPRPSAGYFYKMNMPVRRPLVVIKGDESIFLNNYKDIRLEGLGAWKDGLLSSVLSFTGVRKSIISNREFIEVKEAANVVFKRHRGSRILPISEARSSPWFRFKADFPALLKNQAMLKVVDEKGVLTDYGSKWLDSTTQQIIIWMEKKTSRSLRKNLMTESTLCGSVPMYAHVDPLLAKVVYSNLRNSMLTEMRYGGSYSDADDAFYCMINHTKTDRYLRSQYFWTL